MNPSGTSTTWIKFLPKFHQFRPEGFAQKLRPEGYVFPTKNSCPGESFADFLVEDVLAYDLPSTSLCKHCNLHLIHLRNQSTNHVLKTTVPKHESKYDFFN